MFGASTTLDLLREIAQAHERNDIERQIRAHYTASSEWRRSIGGPSLLSRVATLIDRVRNLAPAPAA